MGASRGSRAPKGEDIQKGEEKEEEETGEVGETWGKMGETRGVERNAWW